VRGRKTGTGCTLRELARLVGVSHNHLRSIRDAALDP
jgi:transcriptional regulator with XRE-family HTH domain